MSRESDWARLLAALERLTEAVERLADNYAEVHKLRVTVCPECHQGLGPNGRIVHVSGCGWGWPDPSALRIPGDVL